MRIGPRRGEDPLPPGRRALRRAMVITTPTRRPDWGGRIGRLRKAPRTVRELPAPRSPSGERQREPGSGLAFRGGLVVGTPPPTPGNKELKEPRKEAERRSSGNALSTRAGLLRLCSSRRT